MIGGLVLFALMTAQVALPAPDTRTEPVINTGAGLLENCTVDSSASSKVERDFHLGLCIGFIKGVTNTLSEQRLADICPPGELTNEDLKDVVVTWLRKHPELLEAPAVGAVVSATNEAFPCEAVPHQVPSA